MSTRPPSLVRADRDIYSVGRLNREVRQLLDHGLPLLWVEGEISNFSRPASGHWYFSLKDEGAQIQCAMFGARKRPGAEALEDGAKVIEVNPTPTPLTRRATIAIAGSAGEVLPDLLL